MNDSNKVPTKALERWAPVIVFIALSFIAIGYQNYSKLPQRTTDDIIYLDDVAISFDNSIVFQDEISIQSKSESSWRLYYAHLDNDTFNSPPSSIAMECKYLENYLFGIVYPTFPIPSSWDKVNVTWYFMLSKKVLFRDNVNQQFDISMEKDGDSVSRLYCGISIANNQPHVNVGIIYFGDDPPNNYLFRQDVDISYNEWHKLVFILKKPSLLIYFDDNLVTSTSAHSYYLTDEIVFRWRTFHLDSS